MNWLNLVFFVVGTLLSLFGASNSSRIVYGPRVTDFRATNSKFGIAIAYAKGTVRQGGNCIWASDVTEVEVQNKECTSAGGLFGFGGSKTCTTTITYEYYQSFAIAFGVGPADALLRVFADGQLIADYRSTNKGPATGIIFQNDPQIGVTPGIRFFKGDGTNIQNNAMLVAEGDTPVYTDICYAVFNNFQLKTFGNRIPTITAEIVYATDSTDFTIDLIDTAPSETTVFVSNEYIIAQDTNSYTVIDAYNKQNLLTNTFAFTTGLNLPYTDKYNHIYSSYMYTGSASTLVQYDLISSDILWEYDLGDPSSNIVALDFDYRNGVIVALSNIGMYKMPVQPEYTIPVIRSSAGVSLYSTNTSTQGVYASDIIVDGNTTCWAVRYDTATNKKTYLVKYAKEANYVGEVIGPLTYSGYTNPVDSSTTLAQGEYITCDSTYVYIGSNTYNWVAAIKKSTGLVTYFRATTIAAEDRTNFRSARSGLNLHLNSGEILQFPDLTVEETIDLNTAFTGVTYGTVLHAYYLSAFDAYFLYDSTSTYYAYLRYSAAGDTLDNICSQILNVTQLEALPSLTSLDTDFTALSTIIVDGYIVDAQRDLTQIYEPLAKVYSFDIIESDGKLKAVLRGSETEAATIAEDELTSAESDIPVISLSKLQETELPREVSVTYYQKSLDYQQATQRATRPSKLAVNKDDIATDLVLTSTDAVRAAEKILKDAWKGKDQYTFTLPRKYAFLDPSDLIVFITNNNDTLYIRINEIAYGENMALQCTGSSYLSAIYSSNSTGIESEFVSQEIINAYPLSLNIYDIPYIL